MGDGDAVAGLSASRRTSPTVSLVPSYTAVPLGSVWSAGAFAPTPVSSAALFGSSR
ncbi:hypothetical protein [Eggerthella lenta]|uniref:hypothetical protein n=1 Tax=Eggerthella lenta TaxID=84112 RepID=UPI001F24F519|nr:hypothetical protein [Eggerthella lenta]